MSHTPRLVFAGTPEFAAQHLRALIAADLTPIAVYTQPDRPAGRGRKLQASAVKAVAQAADIPVLQPASLKSDETQQALADLQPDVLIVVAYGLILPQAILDIPAFGCVNVHASLLPQWRGAAPIQRAIEAGDTDTGVTIMQMDAGLDTGDMLLKVSCPINSDETSASLHDKLATLGANALPQAITDLLAGRLKPVSQDNSQATYADKLTKAEGRINWQDSALTIDRKLRAFFPWPGSQVQLADVLLKCRGRYYSENDESRTKPGTIVGHEDDGLVIQTEAGQLLLTHLQFPGKRMASVSDLLNAYAQQLVIGAQFS